MGNRKQNLKKSLGLSEYPWSSDDEDEIPQQPTEEILQRTDREPRPSVADVPGTSGVQQQPEPASPATVRRIQANMDRDLFWSIINNTRTNNNIPNPRPTISEQAMPVNVRSTTSQTLPPPRPRIDIRIPEQRIRRSERHPVTADVQRIIAFKKLTRSLQNLAQNRGTTHSNRSSSHSSQRITRPLDRPAHRPPAPAGAPPPGPQQQGPPQPGPPQPGAPSRSALFTPTITHTRDGYNYRLPWRRSLPTYPTSNQVQPVVNSWRYQTEPAQSNSAANVDAPSTSQMQQVPFVQVVDHSEDELQPVVTTSVQSTEPRDEVNDNIEEESGEAEAAHNETGSGARLIEEVVEVEAPDETDNNPPPPGTEGDEEVAEPNAENNTSADTANSEENAETTPEGPSFHGVKRKRDSADETNELFSVQEFNQSLLRLLECPVCLEWMEPPISQCRRGHLVCSRCRTRLVACPVCRTPFSSVRNRAMEGVAEMLRYPCRHGCGREVRLRRRGPHEASCGARRYLCPAPACARHPALPRDELPHHFQCKHLSLLKIGCKHKFSMKVNSEQHDTWIIMALDEFFHLRVDVDIRTWGVIVYVAYIGPKRNAKSYTYEVTVEGQHNSRKLVYTRSTHSDLESSSVNVSRQDCFHLTLDQALNFLRFKNRHCEPDKFLDFDVEISKWESVEDPREDSDS